MSELTTGGINFSPEIQKIYPNGGFTLSDEYKRGYAEGKASVEKIGHWIESTISNEEYVCSRCGGACWHYDNEKCVLKSRYCPNCGAKMIEKRRE